MTVNLSRSGALIRIAPNDGPTSVPRKGDALLAEVPLPANRRFEPRCLSCQGVAVRVTQNEEDGCWLIAVKFQQIQFCAVTAQAKPLNVLAAMSGGNAGGVI